MKYLAGLVFFNGLLFLYSSLSNFMEGTLFRYFSYTLSPTWYLIGLLVGVPLCISAIGMLMKRSFFYSLAVTVYRIIIVYATIGEIWSLVKGTLDQVWVPTILVWIQILIYYLLQRSIAKARTELTDTQDIK